MPTEQMTYFAFEGLQYKNPQTTQTTQPPPHTQLLIYCSVRARVLCSSYMPISESAYSEDPEIYAIIKESFYSQI